MAGAAHVDGMATSPIRPMIHSFRQETPEMSFETLQIPSIVRELPSRMLPKPPVQVIDKCLKTSAARPESGAKGGVDPPPFPQTAGIYAPEIHPPHVPVST